jgi:ubiquinone/menaquinone biosynthesis C-methylase UbiE
VKIRKTEEAKLRNISHPRQSRWTAKKQMCEEDQKTIRKRELIELYNTTATMYNRRYKGIQSKKYRYFLGQFEKKDVVLDVGCGTGLLVNLLSGKVACIVGVDISTEMLRVASRSPKNKCIESDLIRADADFLPLRDNTFTKIASVSLLQNMPDPQNTIREVARALCDGGVVAITCLRKKYSLSKLKDMVALGAPRLKVVVEWDNNEEDVGVNATKPI